jgi:hypothetical protein
MLTMALGGTPTHCSLGCPKKRRHQRLNHTSSPNRIPRSYVTTSTLPSSLTLDDQSICMSTIQVQVESVWGLWAIFLLPVRYLLSPLSTMPRDLPPPIRAARCAAFPLSAGKSATTPPGGQRALYRIPMCRAWLTATCSPLYGFGSLELHLALKLEPQTWPPPCSVVAS